MASSISDKLSRNGDAAATFAFISSRIRQRRFGTAVALSAAQRLHREAAIRAFHMNMSSSSAARRSCSRWQPFPQKPSGIITAGMSRSSATRPSSGAAGSQAASTIRTISASTSGIPYPGFGYPPGVYNDPAVAIRLQVTPRDASVYVDGYAAGVVDDYDGVFQRLRLVPGPHEIVIYHPKSPHAATARLLQPRIDTHDPPCARTIAARRSPRAAAAAARDACVSRNARRPTGCA